MPEKIYECEKSKIKDQLAEISLFLVFFRIFGFYMHSFRVILAYEACAKVRKLLFVDLTSNRYCALVFEHGSLKECHFPLLLAA